MTFWQVVVRIVIVVAVLDLVGVVWLVWAIRRAPLRNDWP